MSKKSRPKIARVATKRQLARWQRERRLQRWILYGAAFVIALIVAIPAFGYYNEVIARGREAIAVVNNKSLSMDEYVRLLSFREYQMDLTLSYLNQQGASQPGGNQLAQQFQFQRAMMPNQVVLDWADGEVMALAAPKLGVSVSNAEVWQEVKNQLLGVPNAAEQIAEAKRDTEAQERIKNLVKVTGITADEFRRTVEIGQLRQKISEKLAEQIVTPTLQVRVQIVLANKEEDIQKAYSRIQGGEDFAKVAQEVSIDGLSKETGGELGWVPKGLRAREFDNVVFGMSPGQMSEPFNSGEGYYIVKLLERDEARYLDAATLEELKAGALTRWLEEEKEQAKVEYRITSEKQLWAQDKIGKMRSKLAKQVQQPAR